MLSEISWIQGQERVKLKMSILEVKGLRTYFNISGKTARVVDGISFSLEKGKTMALVGESGCGKTITSLSITGLVPEPNGYIAGGSIQYKNRDLTKLHYSQMKTIRGRCISMIFQEPMTALNPVFTIGTQIMESVLAHEKIPVPEARDRCIKMLKEVGIPAPEMRFLEYPHQLSGGMKQRVMIAIALITNPDILIADEPTTALDVTIQAQIIDLLKKMQAQYGTSLLLITHDLGLVAEIADTITIMYAGKVAEQGDVNKIFKNPSHPYTVGLFGSLPYMHSPGERLHSIKGVVPQAFDFPPGCRFRTRCPEAKDICKKEPDLKKIKNGVTCACHFRK
ncbi:MAG: ABC transporter ATP-binding protein [Spirochaetes bacterium]|nr:ABC transporter ATP-binding protein [Spirochaetota bacterium]